MRIGLAVEFEYLIVMTADNEQRCCRSRTACPRLGKVRTATSRHDGSQAITQLCGRDERGGAAGACAEVAHSHFACVGLGIDPVGCMNEASCEERNIKAVLTRMRRRSFPQRA